MLINSAKSRANTNSVKAPLDLMVGLFLIAANVTSTLPLIPIHLKEVLKVSDFISGLPYILEAIAALILVPVAGRWIDKSHKYKEALCVSLLWLSIGSAMLALFDTINTYFIAFGLFFSAFGIAISQIFAIHHLRSSGSGVGGISPANVRLAYIGGWLAGPTISSAYLIADLSWNKIMLTQSLVYLALSFLAFFIFVPIQNKHKSPMKQKISKNSVLIQLRENTEFVIVVLIISATLSGDILRIAMLPNYISVKINGSPQDVAIAFLLVPLAEIPFTIAAVQLARKIGEKYTIVFGLLIAFLSFFVLAISHSILGVFASQILYAFAPATAIGVGIAYTQNTLTDLPSFAASIVSAAQSMAKVTGCIMLAGGTLIFGIQHIYILPTILFAFLLAITIAFFGLQASKR